MNKNYDTINYKPKVVRSVNDEFERFREKEIQQSPEQVFEDCHKIYFNREITDYLTSDLNGLSSEHYRCLYEDRGCILPNLWDFYLKSEYATVDTWEEIGEMVVDYNERYYSDILTNEKERNHVAHCNGEFEMN